ncbi:hypothetical protein [Flavobacterium granuli]|uniref:Yip1 domain-containing protein n=1 Tax=Flavobacterium granuli TaxID=280093 RepID=A0A1M5U2T4_9FLAO|nr:hypothetical protein [Flavobacterium granuli]PRZ19597.1 hypothetical protein BC624_11516 [Flavobacterium granuli]SHH57279.1 hypothetical protein SAMN05443373_11716 [Flavobacterium granuli]
MKNSFFKFLVLCLLSILINTILSELLHIKELIYSSLSEQLTSRQIEQYFEFQDKWQWLSYIFVPVMLLIKTTLISSVIYIGIFFFSKIPITFKQLWYYVITAESVFLLVPLFKIIRFYFFQTNYTLEDIQSFYPLSALNIVGHKGLEPWLIYPFQILNLFELAYWLVLAYFIGKITETNMDRGLKIVASSYGSALLLWVTMIMFFTLNYS